MDRDCIIITSRWEIFSGVSSGDGNDFVRIENGKKIKGRYIGNLPTSISSKAIRVYVEEEMYTKIMCIV